MSLTVVTDRAVTKGSDAENLLQNCSSIERSKVVKCVGQMRDAATARYLSKDFDMNDHLQLPNLYNPTTIRPKS